jgi:hypothetical protein
MYHRASSTGISILHFDSVYIDQILVVVFKFTFTYAYSKYDLLAAYHCGHQDIPLTISFSSIDENWSAGVFMIC